MTDKTAACPRPATTPHARTITYMLRRVSHLRNRLTERMRSMAHEMESEASRLELRPDSSPGTIASSHANLAVISDLTARLETWQEALKWVQSEEEKQPVTAVEVHQLLIEAMRDRSPADQLEVLDALIGEIIDWRHSLEKKTPGNQ